MTSLPPSRTAQQMDDLERALGWMTSLGVQVDPGRLAAYRKIAEKWDDLVGGRSKLGLRELYPVIATFAYEVTALVTIHHAFSATPRALLAGLVDRLDAAVGEPIRIDGARGGAPDPAREALFGVLSAAYLQQVATDGKATLDKSGGIGFAHGRHHLSVACGRPGAHASLGAALTKSGGALAQALVDRQGARQRGLIALDASALLASAAGLPQAGARAATERAADMLLAEYVDQNMDRIQTCLQAMDRRIIGVMVLFATAALADDEREFSHVGRWALVWRDQVNFNDSDLLGRLRDALRGNA